MFLCESVRAVNSQSKEFLNDGQGRNGAMMETRWRDGLKKAKIVYWIIVGGLAFFVVVIVLGTLGTLSSGQILEIGRWYFFLLIAGMILQMIARRL
jgi:hypothetical protein